MEIFKLIFRKKTLNSILFIIVVAIIRESMALGFDEGFEELFSSLEEQYKDKYILILIAILKLFLSKGSWITLSILGVLLLFFGILKYKELSNANNKIPYLDLELYNKNANRPIQHNRGSINQENDETKVFQHKSIEYNFEWHWHWLLKIRNNSEATAYSVKLYFPGSKYPFDYLERLNANEPIKSNKSKDLNCNVVIRKATNSFDAKKYRNSKFPPQKGIESLEILVEYQDESRNTYYTLFKEKSVKEKNQYLRKKPWKWRYRSLFSR